MEKSGQYKGIFYKNKITHRYYEGGAHFSYFALFKKLKELKQDLNNERNTPSPLNSTPSSKGKEEEYKKIIDLKKFNIPLLSKQKNQSMACLFNDSNKKIKGNDIYSNIIKNEFYKTKNIEMKQVQKAKDAENDKYIKKINNINKYFNGSIYSVKNQVIMPLIYNQKNKRENKNFKNCNESSYNNEFKENNKKGKMDKMNSTIGFKENNKYLRCYLNNYYDNNQNISSYKNINLSCLNSKNKKKNNNRMPMNKFVFVNNLKNKNLKISKNKIHNSNSFDFNIKTNNLVKIGENFLNNTKFGFNSNKYIKNKSTSNDSKNKDKYNMNISIFNFSKLKRLKKFQINKNIK